MNGTFNFKQAKARIDLAVYLASLGHHPAVQRGSDIWFYSPFHEEKTPSFKIDGKHQIWYDHSLGTGGDLIDLGLKIHGCSYAELLQKFKDFLSFQQQNIGEAEHILPKKTNGMSHKKIKILAERPIYQYHLRSYLHERCIPLDLANQYVREVDFTNNASKDPDKIYTALGFKNDCGGYELRTKNFKSSSAPKSPTFISNLSPEEAKSKPKAEQSIAVIEGFFSFLSFQMLHFHNKMDTVFPDNFLVLNSLSFFKKSFGLLDTFGEKMLFLDNDAAGKSATEEALQLGKTYKDYSKICGEQQDLNALLLSTSRPQQRQSTRVKFRR